MINLNLNKNGYLQIQNNYFNLNEKILDNFNDVFEKFPSSWEKTSVINKLEIISNYELVFDIYKKILEIINFNSLDTKVRFDDVWFSKTQKSQYKIGELPNIPHIDKIRKLKAMIYLNHVTEYDGPIYLTSCDVNRYEKLRLNLKKDHKKNLENTIKDIPLNKYLPIVGNFGNLIIFDTNTPHFAGPFLKDNITRKVIRFNFRYI